MPQRARRAAATLWAFWLAYTHEVAHWQAVIWLNLVYFLVVGPTSLLTRLLGKPLLPSTFGRPGSHWQPRHPAPRDLTAMQRMS
jgi:hypothetical protein